MSLWRDNPCKHCVAPKRQPGCHGWCVERKEWLERVNADKAAIKAQKEKDDAVCSTMRMFNSGKRRQ